MPIWYVDSFVFPPKNNIAKNNIGNKNNLLLNKPIIINITYAILII